MALKGSVVTTSSHGRSLTLNWTAIQPEGENKSTVSWSLKGSGSASGWVAVTEVRVTINGSIVFSRSSSNSHIQCRNGTVIQNGSINIPHKADGTKAFSIKVEAGIYNSSINCSGKATFTLDTIALSSAINSAANIVLGNPCEIKWTPAAAVYTYRLRFVYGDWEHTTGIIAPNQTSEYTYNGYIIPIGDIAPFITNSKTGVMTVYLITYSDSAGGKPVGTISNKTFIVTVPNTLKPTLSNVTAMIDNSENSVVAGWGIAVTNISKVRICATASVDGTYGSTIVGYTISGGYNKIIYASTLTTPSSLDYTGEIISASGTKNFTVTVTDSRGYSSEIASTFPASINFLPYSEPKISLFKVQREYSDTSEKRTKISVKANWLIDSLNSNNSISEAILYYKLPSATSWTNYGDIRSNQNTQFYIEYPYGGDAETGFDEANSYIFRLIVWDTIRKKAISYVTVPTGEVLLDFKDGGKGLGVGRIATSDRLEIGLETIFMNKDKIKVIDYGNQEVSLEEFICSVARSLTSPQIIVQPESMEINLGDALKVSLKARGIGLGYQWYYKKTDQADFTAWSGRTNATENFTPDASWNGACLYCAVTDSNLVVTNSNIITISINQE